MKIFKVSGAIDTTDKETAITLVFPEPVQYVALSGFTNDHQITYRFHFENVDGKVWRAVVMRTDQQVRWIPAVEALGFQL